MTVVLQWLFLISLVTVIVCEISIAWSRSKTLKFIKDNSSGDVYVDILGDAIAVSSRDPGNKTAHDGKVNKSKQKAKKKAADDKRKADARAYMAEYRKTHKLVLNPNTGKHRWVPKEG